MQKVPFSKTDKSTKVKPRRVLFFPLYRNCVNCKYVPQKQITKHPAFELNWYTVIPALHVKSTNFLYKITLVSNIQHTSEQVLYILFQQFWYDEYLATGKPETTSMPEPIRMGGMITFQLENFWLAENLTVPQEKLCTMELRFLNETWRNENCIWYKYFHRGKELGTVCKQCYKQRSRLVNETKPQLLHLEPPYIHTAPLCIIPSV